MQLQNSLPKCHVRTAFLQSAFHLTSPPRVCEIRDQFVWFFWPLMGNSVVAIAGWRIVAYCAETQTPGRGNMILVGRRGACGARGTLQGMRSTSAHKMCCGNTTGPPLLQLRAFTLLHIRASREVAVARTPEADPAACYIFRLGAIFRRGAGGRSREVFSWPSILVATCHALHGEVCSAKTTSRGHYLASCQAGSNDGWLHSALIANVVNITSISQVLNICEELPRRTNTCYMHGKLYIGHTFVVGTALHRCYPDFRGFFLRLSSSLRIKYVRIPVVDNVDAKKAARQHVQHCLYGAGVLNIAC